MNIDWLEWMGYLASLMVLISLLMGSIIRLRWINLIGSGLFSLYGFLLGALPVGFMNLCTVFINIYYLKKIYSSRDDFKILPIEDNTQYFNYFLDFYKKEIEKYADPSYFNNKNFDISFIILRNMAPAGVFIGSQYDQTTLKVELDFVISEYRDFKIGKYIYENNKDYFLNNGYSKFISFSSKKDHIVYLKKMGFEDTIQNGKSAFLKSII